jgi:hypothetical protein
MLGASRSLNQIEWVGLRSHSQDQVGGCKIWIETKECGWGCSTTSLLLAYYQKQSHCLQNKVSKLQAQVQSREDFAVALSDNFPRLLKSEITHKAMNLSLGQTQVSSRKVNLFVVAEWLYHLSGNRGTLKKNLCQKIMNQLWFVKGSWKLMMVPTMEESINTDRAIGISDTNWTNKTGRWYVLV